MTERRSEGLATEEAERRVAERRVRHLMTRLVRSDGTRGDRIADRLSSFLGSWRFIVIQTAIVVAWIVSNVLLIVHFDPYPFIFLNLAFSTQAAYAAPLILLASNRAAMRDRLTLEHAAQEADLEELQNERIIEAIQLLDVRLDRIEGRLGTMPG